MNNNQIIQKQYELIRKENMEEIEARKKTLYDKLPRLKEIEDEMVKLSIDITRAILSKSNTAEVLIDKLKNKQLDLKVEKAEILSANKYPIDYLDSIYKCKLCKDTGFVNYQKCKCYKQREIYLNYEYSNLSFILEKENFEQFRWDYYSDDPDENGISPLKNMQEIYKKCIDFVEQFDEHNKNLFFIGSPGLGKTFLCNSIAKDLLDKGRSVIYMTVPDLIDTMRKYKFDFDKEENYAHYLNEIYNCDLLIMDDLGTELSTQFSNQAIYNILNKRIVNMKKMIISTNLSGVDFQSTYSERIVSRIIGNFEACKFVGKDIRLIMKGIS
ncbi:MAG TPA: ATP-binding protein [Bacillota bacterium]|nr:ATP-binding protein [Bacillota bacterium]HNT03024.1 ATP-binding protein [Bacillota bacterium]HPA54136.1 ATP-binding protein [Bacillota bacterium]HPX67720.1 ATP-binding protein [Bacillota bacterium]HQA65092.1 ATP-binding protein [Bacillota bacterium]